MSHQVELSNEDIKKIITILRFSVDACPIESLPEDIDDVEVKSLISKFEEVISNWFFSVLKRWPDIF